MISATIEDPLRRIVRLRGWEGYCKGVFGRPGTKIEHLHKVLKLESISPEEILFVGDGKRDIDAARSVGCRFIGIRNAFNDFETRGVKMLADLRPLEDAVEELDAEMVVDLPSR